MDYKTLYEQLETEIADRKAQEDTEGKRKLLLKQGYNEKQAEKYLSHVTGETEQEQKQAAMRLADEIPPKKTYVDPSLMNGKRQQPKRVNGEEKGRTLARRLLAKRRGNK
ncbi:hypothetical protein [Gracilibacillus timonensis]|uniref:hypothetical protein n=1 Tax=Gracilibacillus timonensis TaxID=1816696 RepID=UPI000825F192|nr:hypothetical protein [Gracilibacillus timonensis]